MIGIDLGMYGGKNGDKLKKIYNMIRLTLVVYI